MRDPNYEGLLMIGDPHLEGRQPGFRQDDYPSVILQKLEWSLEYALQHQLLPVLLGDLFDKPRDNPNWMIDRLMNALTGEILGIYGNHDVHYQPELTEHDSLSLLVSSGKIRLVSEETPWTGTIAGRPLVIGGSSYRQNIPAAYDRRSHAPDGDMLPLVVWLTHHDVLIPGYDEGRIKPTEIDGIDLIVNGHIHRRLETIVAGNTHWLTPGNIARRSRSDAVREHIPSVLRVGIADNWFTFDEIEIPHAPFDEVFYPAVAEAVEAAGTSAFVAGLAELQSRRTAGGAGLKEFLDQNLDQFEPNIRAVIWQLAEDITQQSQQTESEH